MSLVTTSQVLLILPISGLDQYYNILVMYVGREYWMLDVGKEDFQTYC